MSPSSGDAVAWNETAISSADATQCQRKLAKCVDSATQQSDNLAGLVQKRP